MDFLYISLFAGAAAIVYSLWQTARILALPKGTPDMIAISDAIAEGAQAYLARQYKVIGIIAAVIFAVLWLFQGNLPAFSYWKHKSFLLLTDLLLDI